jgi:hypothetical protein
VRYVVKAEWQLFLLICAFVAGSVILVKDQIESASSSPATTLTPCRCDHLGQCIPSQRVCPCSKTLFRYGYDRCAPRLLPRRAWHLHQVHFLAKAPPSFLRFRQSRWSKRIPLHVNIKAHKLFAWMFFIGGVGHRSHFGSLHFSPLSVSWWIAAAEQGVQRLQYCLSNNCPLCAVDYKQAIKNATCTIDFRNDFWSGAHTPCCASRLTA